MDKIASRNFVRKGEHRKTGCSDEPSPLHFVHLPTLWGVTYRGCSAQHDGIYAASLSIVVSGISINACPGNPREINTANAIYTYNKANRNTNIENKLGNSAMSSYKYSYYFDGSDACKVCDENGIMETASYEYDGLNQLIGFTDGDTTASYAYNVNGLRYKKTLMVSGARSTSEKHGTFHEPYSTCNKMFQHYKIGVDK